MPMAPRAARRGAPVLVLLVVGLLSVTALVAAGLLLPIPRPDLCATLVTIALDGVARGCGDVARASAALAAGRAAADRKAYRDALAHYRVASTASPAVAGAHVARGELAEMLGEYDEALAAFQQAAAIAPSADTSLRLGATADRLGRADLAVQTLEAASGPWRQHAAAGARAAAASFAACAPTSWSNPARLWNTCVTGSPDTYGVHFEASPEGAPRWA